MICPTCLDVHFDEEYQRCEWCRLGAPMEAALEVVIGFEAWVTVTGRISSSKPNLQFTTLKARKSPESVFFGMDFAEIEKRVISSLMLPPEMVSTSKKK